MSETLIVIPARWGSSRLPGKPLADLGGQPMIARVVAAALGIAREIPGADVLVATDDGRVARAAEAAGAETLLTADHHGSGTERLLEVMERRAADRYLNLQGDEPLFPSGEGVRVLAALVEGPQEIVSLCHPIDPREAADPHAVKVVCGHAGDALYFSRSPIPYPRDAAAAHYLKHVGVYGYTRTALERIRRLEPAALERAEGLEQLRWLQAGERIRMLTCTTLAPGVDTEADLERVRRLLLEPDSPDVVDPLAAIQLLICDVDGVLTDGRLYYGSEGESLKCFHVRDGLGIRMLETCGVRVALMSGRDSAPLRRRAADLQLQHVRFGIRDKAAACRELMEALGLARHQVAFVGDDSIDLPALMVCGVSFAVADAPAYLRAQVDHVLSSRGGNGAVREVAEKLLEARDLQHHLQSAESYSRVAERMGQ